MTKAQAKAGITKAEPKAATTSTTKSRDSTIRTTGKVLTHNARWDKEEAPHKHLLVGESHSKSAMAMIAKDPNLSNAIREKLGNALLDFANGEFKDDIKVDPSRTYIALAKEMFNEIRKDEDQTLTDYSHLFTNFACIVGNMGYCGSIPCFRFKVKFVQANAPFWLSLFFTPTEAEDEVLHDDHAADSSARAGMGFQSDTANRLVKGPSAPTNQTAVKVQPTKAPPVQSVVNTTGTSVPVAGSMVRRVGSPPTQHGPRTVKHHPALPRQASSTSMVARSSSGATITPTKSISSGYPGASTPQPAVTGSFVQSSGKPS